MTMNDRRLPAEWENSTRAIMLAWPHADTDWAGMLDEVERCYVEIVKAITTELSVVILSPDPSIPSARLDGISPERIFHVKTPTNDTWTRDYGPITVEIAGEATICDFQFNGWGLKFAACHDNRATSRLCSSGVLSSPRENRLDFVLEGGSIERDGNGVMLTTAGCLLAPNRNQPMGRHEIEEYLAQCFGLKRLLWLEHGSLQGDDTDGHIDTLARLAPCDTILYTGAPDDRDDPHYAPLTAMASQLREFRTLDGRPFNLIELPIPDPVYDENGDRLPATYANYLVTPRSIILPTYNQPKKDFLASQIVKIAFPGHSVKTVDCRALIKQHGSLHCATMQLHRDSLKTIL